MFKQPCKGTCLTSVDGKVSGYPTAGGAVHRERNVYHCNKRLLQFCIEKKTFYELLNYPVLKQLKNICYSTENMNNRVSEWYSYV